MNKRIKRKQRKRYLQKLAKQAGVELLSHRKVQRKQLISVQKMNYDFFRWIDDIAPKK